MSGQAWRYDTVHHIWDPKSCQSRSDWKRIMLEGKDKVISSRYQHLCQGSLGLTFAA